MKYETPASFAFVGGCLIAAALILVTTLSNPATGNPQDPAGGATLCANNPFCLPDYLRQPLTTSGEAR